MELKIFTTRTVITWIDTTRIPNALFQPFIETGVFLKRFMAQQRWFIMINNTKKYIYKYVNSLHYKQRSLLHVSRTYCGHLQGMERETSRHNTTTSAWMVSSYTQHTNTQFSTNNFINILHFDTIKPFI